jgi:hypothetical protein
MNDMNRTITFALIALAACLTAQAQTTDAQTVHVVGAQAIGSGTRGITMAFRTQSMMDAEPVKGSPFCATITSDHTQQFADGNRIHTSEDSQLCRDSQGRTRREAQLELLGAVPQGAAPKIITIEDPAAGVRYTLDTFAKVARKMPLGPMTISTSGAKGDGPKNVFFSRASAAPDDALPPLPPAGGQMIVAKRVLANGGATEDSDSAKESLGDQTINGIHATGTRMTTTIPAAKMGNEQPINVVSENWYSPDLKATVMTKHSDPWAGTLTTQFSSVNTSEPDPSLFTVPSDYKVVDEKAEPFVIKMQAPTAAPAQP